MADESAAADGRTMAFDDAGKDKMSIPERIGMYIMDLDNP